MAEEIAEGFAAFPATRRHALERLHAFVPRMGSAYARERGFDPGPEHRNAISALSPFHAHRLLLEEETVLAALQAHGLKGAEKFISEVYWRTYFKGWLESRPSVWVRYLDQVSRDLASLSTEDKARYEAAIRGATGLEPFDHWAKELVQRGYLHNHVRMWFASIWIFTLGLPWALGADFFYRHLLDGDAASNTLSWRWVAGLHTSGEPYGARADNISKYTNGRFNPEGLLNENPQGLSDDWNGAPGPVPAPQPPERGVPTILLLHEDDLGFESLSLAGLDVVAIAGITVTDDRSPEGVSEDVKRFAIDAVEDALSRANEDLFIPTVKLANPDGLPDFAKQHGAAQVVYGYAPVGPVQDRLQAAAPGWRNAGLSAYPILRDYDREAWPHATKGFFKLREKIGELTDKVLARSSES
ncbi:MAG: FAD-binding domain-containing protein [Parvularcula sp.]|jgi:deoxyribodipyrimidine photo-lyase|nr:FAD-binding domain-containing protein [Parvularcula sp.]